MNCYRKAKLAIQFFHNLTNLITPPTKHYLQRYTTTSSNKLSVSPLIPPKPSIFNTARKYYYVDQNGFHHFRKPITQRLIGNETNLFTAVAATAGIAVSVYYLNLETVPYSKRTRFVLLPSSVEIKLGAYAFKSKKRSLKVLSDKHPQSVRVRMISNDIIQGLMRGVKNDKVWSDGRIGKDYRRSVQATRKYLDKLNWEVIVVEKPVVNAYCHPGGKVVVYTGLLNRFKNDAEVAAIIGHEVGHAVGRHSAAGTTRAIVQMILEHCIKLRGYDFLHKVSKYFLKLPFSRKMEKEADYIGLLLMASAGYDPRFAVVVEKKLAERESSRKEYLSTHPSGNKRVQLLTEAMGEAVTIYKEVKDQYRIRKRQEGGLELSRRW